LAGSACPALLIGVDLGWVNIPSFLSSYMSVGRGFSLRCTDVGEVDLTANPVLRKCSISDVPQMLLFG